MSSVPALDNRMFQGIRVIELAQFVFVPAAGALLADLGADVIKIESSTRLDSLRMAGPYKDGKPGVNRSGYFADRNTSKRGITVDMKHPKALGLIRKLIAQSDIVANNFAAGVMEKFGLGYEDCKRIRPTSSTSACPCRARRGRSVTSVAPAAASPHSPAFRT